jgi:hypothetical protein
MNFKLLVCFIFIFFMTISSHALEAISEDVLDTVTGQDGVSLSGELSFNEDGGPLTSVDSGGIWGTCTEKNDSPSGADRCGARLAVKPNATDGWIALDELKGSVSFEGLTLRSRDIDATDDFGGDEDEAGITGKTVLEIGLPNEIKFKEFSYSYVTSSQGRPTDVGYQEQVRHGIDFNGSVQMQGNILVFPVGNP